MICWGGVKVPHAMGGLAQEWDLSGEGESGKDEGWLWREPSRGGVTREKEVLEAAKAALGGKDPRIWGQPGRRA